MPLKCGSESTDYQYYQIHELDRAMATMEKFGIDPVSEAYQALWKQRGKILGQIGRKVPRDTLLLAWSFGFSPGIIKVWLDVEEGWMAEARVKPKAPPVYRAVSDEVAMAILKEEVTPELEKELMTPVDYYGE